jgi:hypothetical protein
VLIVFPSPSSHEAEAVGLGRGPRLQPAVIPKQASQAAKAILPNGNLEVDMTDSFFK